MTDRESISFMAIIMVILETDLLHVHMYWVCV